MHCGRAAENAARHACSPHTFGQFEEMYTSDGLRLALGPRGRGVPHPTCVCSARALLPDEAKIRISLVLVSEHPTPLLHITARLSYMERSQPLHGSWRYGLPERADIDRERLLLLN